MMKKFIFILFITLFLSIDVYAESSIEIIKTIKDMPEYNDEEFKQAFTKYCDIFNEKITLLYVDRMFDVLLKSGTDEDVYRFVTNCIQENNENNNNKLFYDKMVEDKYHTLISKYYNYLFALPSFYDYEHTYYNIQFKLFYDKLNKEDVKSYINIITSDEYIITPNDYENLSLLQNKIDEKDMKVISLKFEKDIVKYAKSKFNNEFNLYMEQFEKSGVNNIYTLDFLNKNYAVDIDYNLLLKLIKAYYDDKATIYMSSDDDLGRNKDNLKNIDSVFEHFLSLSNLEIHHGDALGRYAYTGSKPLKIKGIFTLSNINNVEIAYPNDRLNGYLPKTDFMSYDKSVQLNQISIRPKKFTYSSNIYPNILETGLLGEVNFDAEITIGMDSKIDLSRDPEENIITMYIDEVKLNKVTGSVKYNKEEYGKPYSNTYVYKLSSSDGYVNLRNAPNGKIIQKININNKDTLVYHYAGLYDFKNSEGSLYVENLQGKFYKKSFDYYNKINKLLNMKDLKSGSWYKVVYFPDETNEDAVTGYIHSSQLEFIKKSDNEYY